MTHDAQPDPNDRPSPDGDIAEATNQLFQDIAAGVGNPALREDVLAMNEELATFRPYEATLIPDRAEEYAALSESWAARDWPRLKVLIAAYFARRQALAPQLSQLINRPN